jgi:hypothetical protein
MGPGLDLGTVAVTGNALKLRHDGESVDGRPEHARFRWQLFSSRPPDEIQTRDSRTQAPNRADSN